MKKTLKLDFRNMIVTCSMNHKCGIVNEGSHNDIELYIKGYTVFVTSYFIIKEREEERANNILMVFRK